MSMTSDIRNMKTKLYPYAPLPIRFNLIYLSMLLTSLICSKTNNCDYHGLCITPRDTFILTYFSKLSFGLGRRSERIRNDCWSIKV